MSAVGRIRVAIVDDHSTFRGTLRLILEREQDLCVVAEAENGLAAVQMAEVHEPDVILMDVRMPLMDGLEATRIITSKCPKTKVVVISMLADEGTRWRASEAGAVNFCSKECNAEGLVAVIRDGHSRGLQGVTLHKSAKSSTEIISDLVKSIAREPDQVAVHDRAEFPLAFEVQVSLMDYELVLSKLAAITALAGSFAGLSERQQLLIHITPV